MKHEWTEHGDYFSEDGNPDFVLTAFSDVP